MPISVARPYDEEELKKEMARVQSRYQSPPMQKPEKGLMQTIGESVATNAVNKVADAGIDAGKNKLAAWWGGPAAGAPYAATGQTAMGMAPGQLLAMGANPAAAGSVAATGAGAAGAAGTAAGAGGMAALASNPLGWAVLGGLALKKLFRNKGGAVGPLSLQYKANGGEAWDGYRGPDYEDFVDWDGYRGPDYEEDLIDIEPTEGVPFNQGGNVQHKEHGGMMAGPLSNNKSIKIEKKETIEYKN